MRIGGHRLGCITFRAPRPDTLVPSAPVPARTAFQAPGFYLYVGIVLLVLSLKFRGRRLVCVPETFILLNVKKKYFESR